MDNTDPLAGGAKYDADKPRWELLPVMEIDDVAKVMTFGAKKYAVDNWRSVDRTGRYIAAAFRHLAAYQNGEDIDADSGLPHLAHAATDCLMALWHSKNRPEHDDRFKVPTTDSTAIEKDKWPMWIVREGYEPELLRAKGHDGSCDCPLCVPHRDTLDKLEKYYNDPLSTHQMFDDVKEERE